MYQSNNSQNKDSQTLYDLLNTALYSKLSDYIIETGYWGDNKLIINDIINQTFEVILERAKENEESLCLETVETTNFVRKSKLICSEKIRKLIINNKSIKEIKDIIKNNANDDKKLLELVKLKMHDMEESSGINLQEKLMRHEKQMKEYDLNFNDIKYIERAFVTFNREGNYNSVIISECQYIFALFFGYNISHKQIADYEHNHLLKIDSEHKSIKKLRNCLKNIFNFAKELKKKVKNSL